MSTCSYTVGAQFFLPPYLAWVSCVQMVSLRRSVLLRPRSVLKFAVVILVAEAANIECIGHKTTMPIPRIQDVFTIEHRTNVAMEYINASELML